MQMQSNVFDLWMQAAPKSVDTFVQLIQGQLQATCMDEDLAYDEDAFGVSDRCSLVLILCTPSLERYKYAARPQGQADKEADFQIWTLNHKPQTPNHRDKLTKKQIYKQCKASEGTPRSYQYSTNWSGPHHPRLLSSGPHHP